MSKEVSAKEFILSLGRPYFHHIRNQFCRINPNQLESIDPSLYLIGMESQKYAMALETFIGEMPDEEGEFLLSQLITRMNIVYTFKEHSDKQEMSDLVDRIYNTYSQLKEYFKEH